jgi:sugar (pentulose or hexulose) kinase
LNDAPAAPCFLGIDAGTTSLKAALFDEAGHLLASAGEEYRLLTPGPAVVELDPEVYWDACCRAIRAAVAKGGVAAGRISALAISSQGETLIPVDPAGRPTRNAIVWLDNRAVDEALEIGGRLDVETAYRISGQPEVTPTWPACKILWLRRHEPATFVRSAYYLLVEDFLLHRLTGAFVTDCSVQSSSLLLDISGKRWWPAALEAAGIGAGQLGRLLQPGAIVGPLSRAGAEATGLTPRTLAVTGGMDQMLGAVGAGNITAGVISEMTGGALAVVATTDQPRFDPLRRVPCHYHGRPNLFALLAWNQTAGMALKWFRDEFCAAEMEAAARAGRDTYDDLMLMAAAAPAGCQGMTMLPHLEGAACPEFNPGATGVFFGATLRHGRPHFIRSILEAVAYMLRQDVELVEELGASAQEIRSIGGGARSPLWVQIKADVLQCPVTTLACEEVACLGAAMSAATAAGHFASLEEAAATMVRTRRTFEPDAANAAVYEAGYQRYLELYRRLEPMF